METGRPTAEPRRAELGTRGSERLDLGPESNIARHNRATTREAKHSDTKRREHIGGHLCL